MAKYINVRDVIDCNELCIENIQPEITWTEEYILEKFSHCTKSKLKFPVRILLLIPHLILPLVFSRFTIESNNFGKAHSTEVDIVWIKLFHNTRLKEFLYYVTYWED